MIHDVAGASMRVTHPSALARYPSVIVALS